MPTKAKSKAAGSRRKPPGARQAAGRKAASKKGGAKKAATKKKVAKKKPASKKVTAKKKVVGKKPAPGKAAPKKAAAKKAAPVTSRTGAAKKKPAGKTEAPPLRKVTAVRSAAGPSPKTRGGRSRKRRSARREPKDYAPGDLVLPGGAMNADEVVYFLRGCVAAEAPAGEQGIIEIVTKRGDDAPLDPEELSEQLDAVTERFEQGAFEPQIPNRPPGSRQTFASIVERARHRRREIGAFLRGLDLGGTETSHMDPHGEASLQNLMEWAARLEVLTEADQPPQTDFAPFHRVLDQLELNTESLILDVEQTLRRLRRHAS